MGFLRPKSRGKNDEAEQKRRNRLSKPLTNKSQTNLRAAAEKQDETEESITRRSQQDFDEVVQSPTKEEARHKVRARLFGHDDQRIPSPQVNPPKVKTGIAQLVARYETGRPLPSPSQSSVNHQTKARPLSAAIIESHVPISAHQRVSCAPMAATYRSFPQVSESPVEDRPWDQSQGQWPTPTRRRSNFKPGEATRTQSSESVSNSSTKESHLIATEKEQISRRDELRDEKADDSSDDWSTAHNIPVARAETPKGIDCRVLGDLSLGSLHITNGRASPDLADISVQPRDRQMPEKHRDVSSEYGDSEAWEDEAIPGDDSDGDSAGQKTPTTELRRNFSFAVGAEAHLTAKSKPSTPEPPRQNLPSTPPGKSPGAASALAEEYMAELPASPFVEPLELSSPTGSTGSVVRHKLDDDHDDFVSLADNSVTQSPLPQRRNISNESHSSSIDSRPSQVGSKLSLADSRYAQDEIFQSAVEFQHYHQPPSTQRPRAPFMTEELAKSDSGYSSNNSIRSTKVEEENRSLTVSQHALGIENMEQAPQKVSNLRKLGGFLPVRPAMKAQDARATFSRTPESKPETPKVQDAMPSTLPAEFDASSPLTPTKQRKKLQKFKPITKFMATKPPPVEELVVQRNLSAESYNIPAISPQATANLNIRTQQLPELEKTVRNHTKASGSSSTLVVPQDIRFPTPDSEPEDEERTSRKSKSRNRSRARSKSRRRSMLEFFIGSKDDKRKSVAQQDEPQMTIDDLGDVVAALGTNPYDIAAPPSRAQSRSNSQSGGYDIRLRPHSMDFSTPRSLPPHRISYGSNGPRLTMDDQTASEYARHRSRSIHERDGWHGRSSSPRPTSSRPSLSHRSTFDDRGGIPGKILRSFSEAEDTPPLPPMPSPAEIRRMSGRYDERFAGHAAQHEEVPSWNAEPSPEPEDSAPPPPPPHSPRPSFIDERENDFEEPEDLSLAPPPPCHSPRPMDLHREPQSMSEDGWAAQARAWKARRQSAGETLKAQWADPPHYGHDVGVEYHDERAYYQQNSSYTTVSSSKQRMEYYDGSENWPPPSVQRLSWGGDYDHHPELRHEGNDWVANDHYEENDSYNSYGHFDEPQQPAYYEDVSTYTPPRGRGPRSQHHDSHPNHDRSRSPAGYRNPSPTPSARPLPSRPTSRISHRSNNSAISLADELHPERLERPSPAPAFGRYSGGLQYSYEGREKGFGGSSGTRSMSGKADGQWKGMQLRQGFGVDLGDVPIVGIMKPLR